MKLFLNGLSERNKQQQENTVLPELPCGARSLYNVNTKEPRQSGVFGFHRGGGIRQGFETCAIYKGVSSCVCWWGQYSKQLNAKKTGCFSLV